MMLFGDGEKQRMKIYDLLFEAEARLELLIGGWRRLSSNSDADAGSITNASDVSLAGACLFS